MKASHATDYQTGDKVIAKDFFIGIVAMVYGRYVDIELPKRHIIVTIPSHGEIEKLSRDI